MKKFKKSLIALLSVCMVMTMMPLSVWADGNSTEQENQAQTAAGLPEAVDGVVTLTEDVTTGTLDKNTTYDLNGYNLTYTSQYAISPGQGETLKFIDSSARDGKRGGTLKFTYNEDITLAMLSPKTGGTVTAENICIESACSAFFPQGDAAAVNITNCSVKAALYCVATNAGSSDNYNVKITLKDSVLVAKSSDGDNCAVMINVPGTLSIDNCDITGDRQAVMVRAGDAVIENSKITVTGSYVDNHNYENEKKWGSGNEVPMAAIVVGSQTNAYKADATCTIQDTEINAPENNLKPAVYVSSNDAQHNQSGDRYTSQLNISGEKTKISGDMVVADGTTDDPASVVVKDKAKIAGNITNNSEASAVAVIDGATLTGETTRGDQKNGTIFIESEEDDSSSIVAVNTKTAKTYNTLAEAISKANSGDTIRLVKDIPVQDDAKGNTQGILTITGKTLTIDGNNHTITANQSNDNAKKASVFNIESDAEVTFKDLQIDANNAAKHGLNIYGAEVTVDNCSIKNGTGYGIVCNSSVLTVNSITTEGNGWGGINIDNRIESVGSTFVMNDGTINEKNSVYFENDKKAKITATINNGNFNGYVSIAENTENITFIVNDGVYSNSVAEYATKTFEVAKNEKYTYHATGEEAVEAAKDGGVIAPTKESPEDIEITAPTSGSITVESAIKVNAPSGYYLTSTTNQDGTITYTAYRRSSGGGGSSTPTYSVTAPSNVENGTVAISPKNAAKDKDVTVTVKPNEGYEVDSVKVTDKDGKEVALKDNGDGTYTFKMPASSVSVSASFKKKAEVHVCPADKFTDVDKTLWYHEGIDYVIEKGMMNGTSGATFAPNADTTRGMIVTILYRLEGSPAVASAAGFTDVAAGQYYADAVAWASANGIVTGYDSSKFGPNDKITREQMAAILYRYAGFKKYDVSKTSDLSSYTDNASISGYAADALKWANAEGLVNGMGDGRIAPQGSAVRAQAAALLMRFCENVAK